jgi:hypothetical protein
MNARQRKIVLAGSLIIAAMLLFPPWNNRSQNFNPQRMTYSSGYSVRPVGYGPIFRPPQNATNIDTTRLLMQLLAVVAVAGCLFALAKNKEGGDEKV